MNEKYACIINLPRHESETRPRMSRLDRAAQFAPYSALSGYEEAVEETARLTDSKIELDESEKERINEVLTDLSTDTEDRRVRLVFYRPDNRKSGGSYVAANGEIEKIDVISREITLISGSPIPFDSILEISEI